MSGALTAAMNAGTASTVVFIGFQAVNNGNDTNNGVTYKVPSFAQIGDTVIFYCLQNSARNSASPPGTGWTDASGTLGGLGSVYVKQMASAADLTATTNANGGYAAFTAYRGSATFAVVSGTGFTRSPYHAGVSFFGNQPPAPATSRYVMGSNGPVSSATASDMLPPLNYVSNTNYQQFTAVEFRSQ